MRKLYTDVYGTSFDGEKESEKHFIDSIKTGASEIPSTLFGRVNEFSGILQGWLPNPIDPVYHLEGKHLTKNGIILTDKFSKILTGIELEAFYEYSFPPRGPGAIAPWIFKFIVDYALGKGLDEIVNRLKNKDAQQLANKISIDWGNNNGDSLGEVVINFSNGHNLKIENYPNNIERITIKQKEMIETALKSNKKTSIIYDAWGRVTAYQKDEYGNNIDIII